MKQPKRDQLEMWLSASHGGRALLHLGALMRSRRNLRWYLRGAARNLLPCRRHKPGLAASSFDRHKRFR